MGKRKPQRDLFDVGNVFPLELKPKSFHAQLARVAPSLFRDEDFTAFYAERTGRPSVPPSQLALLTILQHHAGCSDEETVDRSGFDLRPDAIGTVLGREGGRPLCAKSTLQLFRAHLLLHDRARAIFVRSIEEAKQAGLLGKGALNIAVDKKPITGPDEIGMEDTFNLLATGVRSRQGRDARWQVRSA